MDVVRIDKHALTLTGLTGVRLNKLLGCNINCKILAESGISLKKLNKLISEQSDVNADLVIVSMGGNDVFQLTLPWVWRNNINTCVKLLLRKDKNRLIWFSPVPPIGRFPAIQNPIRITFGVW